jgi:glycosyltransferase involved in cell wall biosynthesis
VRTIRDTINSVQLARNELEKQGHLLEHIIIDGDSMDGTTNIAREYAESNEYVKFARQTPSGIYTAMNFGLHLANGLYTHILNSDDLIVNPVNYGMMLDEGRRRDADVMIGSIIYLTNEDNPRPTRVWAAEHVSDRHEIFREHLKKGLHFPHPGFVAKTCIYRVNGFDESYKLAADYKLMQEILLCLTTREKVLLRSDVIVGMREGGATSSIKGIIGGMNEIVQINRELGITAGIWHRYIRKIAKRLGRSAKELQEIDDVSELMLNRTKDKAPCSSIQIGRRQGDV